MVPLKVTYANCYLARNPPGNVVVTEELAVAGSLPPETRSRIADADLDPDVAEGYNIQTWRLAFDWFEDRGEDPTLVDGVSAGDIAGVEVAQTVLLPAARAVMEAIAMLDEFQPTSLTTVMPRGGSREYDRIERVKSDVVASVIQKLSGARCDRLESDDARNTRLFAKYAQSRNPDLLDPGLRWRRAIATTVLRGVNLAAALKNRRPRPILLVHEYNPTRAFAQSYSADPDREHRLARSEPLPADLASIIRAGDRAFIPVPRPSPQASSETERLRRFTAAHADHLSVRFKLGGVDLWPLLAPYLTDVVSRYGAFVARAAPAYRHQLTRLSPEAVLVPFDTPPAARLLVRVAQAIGIPTFVLSDGFKGDDFEAEGMTADHALAWSTALAERYYRRRTHGDVTVTGNPRADADRDLRREHRRIGAHRRILVGSFSFSAVDLNCRHSDPERFLAEVLEGISRSTVAGGQIAVKLHPVDIVANYDEVLAAHGDLPVELLTGGDLTEMFRSSDLYVTTHSTSLLEAAALGLPVVYYRVNAQRVHPPFSGDPFMQRRTAGSPAELAALLDSLAADAQADDPKSLVAWSEQYLGPLDGQSVRRVLAAISDRAQKSETSA